MIDKNATTIDDKEAEERKGHEQNFTQKLLAEYTIKNDCIKLVSSLRAFMVEGIKGSKRVVTQQKCAVAHPLVCVTIY